LTEPTFDGSNPEVEAAQRPTDLIGTYAYSLLRISAISDGMTIKEVPVSMAAPVPSSSSSCSPKVILSSSSSQYPFLRIGMYWISGIRSLIDPAKGAFASILFGRSETEREDWFVDETLSKHVVERRDHGIDGDGIVRHAHDTIEFAEGESESRLLGGLGKILLVDGDVAYGHGILADETLQ